MIEKYQDRVGDKNISPAFRPVPFWSWNDELEPEELRRQIRSMHEAGIGGFFMHARGGLRTSYMGKKWMECVSVSVREACRYGMLAYLYDENGWPSGFGAGKVNGLGVRYQQKYLRFGPVKELPEGAAERIIAWYTGDNAPCFREEAVNAAWYDLNPYYVDNMDPEVVQEFCRQIYEVYYRELPRDVREGLAGVFTDEPQLSRNGIPWSFTLEESFRKEYGQELLPLLPGLFRDCGEFRRTRVAYYALCAKNFRAAFIEPLGAWCRAHGWEFTGHHVLEETYFSQLCSNGAIMPQYTGYTIPGDDHLGRCNAYVTADVQVVSVAAQTGKPQILTETFGTSGWNFNTRGMKWLYQQQLVHGVNLLCQHLEGYTLRGLRKRDYPASLFYQHPMWEHVKKTNDGFSRVGRMLALGRTPSCLLVLHGISTAWMYCAGGKDPKGMISSYNAPFMELSERLDASGIPFHYGDEALMAELGEVRDGRLHVGQCAYDCVAVPPMENLSLPVLKLLKEFHAAGGQVLRMKNPLSQELFTEGCPASAADRDFFLSLPEYEDAAAMVRAAADILPHLEIEPLKGLPGQLRGTWREFPGEKWFFLADFDTLPEKEAPAGHLGRQLSEVREENPVPARITLPCRAEKIEVVDQSSGKVTGELPFLNTVCGASFLYEFPAASSLLLRVTEQPAAPEAKDLSSSWKAENVCNVLTLDRAEYQLDGEDAFHPATDTLAIFNRLLAIPKDTGVTLRYRFQLLPELEWKRARLRMALEKAPGLTFLLNGTELSPVWRKEFFIDRTISVMELPENLLRSGDNTFEIRMFFSQSPEIRASLERARYFEGEANKLFFDSEIESIYLLGDFAVVNQGECRPENPGNFFLSGPFALGTLPETLPAGGLIPAGFPFFSGKLVLRKDFTLTREECRAFTRICLAPFRAESVQITLNGKELGLVCNAPYELPLKNALRTGKNMIELCIAASPRNTLGPLHTAEVEPVGVGPGSFLTETGSYGQRPGPVTELYGVIEPGPAVVELR